MKTGRTYSGGRRLEAAAASREAVLNAASRLLNDQANITMEAVAATAGVTRLTVYNQFGSRRGLLEAVFDEHAMKGGIRELADAVEADDPLTGFDQMIDTLCRFWGENPVIAALQDAAVADAELKQALESRQSRRRDVIDALLAKMNGTKVQLKEAGDMLYALVSLPMFRSLAAGRTQKQVARLLKMMSKATLTAEGVTSKMGTADAPR